MLLIFVDGRIFVVCGLFVSDGKIRTRSCYVPSLQQVSVSKGEYNEVKDKIVVNETTIRIMMII